MSDIVGMCQVLGHVRPWLEKIYETCWKHIILCKNESVIVTMIPNSMLLDWLISSIHGSQKGCCDVQLVLLSLLGPSSHVMFGLYLHYKSESETYWKHIILCKNESVHSNVTQSTAARLTTILYTGLKRDVEMCSHSQFFLGPRCIALVGQKFGKNLKSSLNKNEGVTRCNTHVTQFTAAIDLLLSSAWVSNWMLWCAVSAVLLFSSGPFHDMFRMSAARKIGKNCPKIRPLISQLVYFELLLLNGNEVT
jgi:hypothetical protein